MRVCESQFMGLIPYGEALEIQQEFVELRKKDAIPDKLLLLEHPHVITLGRAAERSNVLVDDLTLSDYGVELFESGRGGDVTYHGPGQLVGYPIIHLAPDRCDVRRYVRDIEEVMIRTAADYGIEATRIDGLTGVWVGREKLGAIGVRISRWVTMHGFAINLNTDLNYFQMIVPCGIKDHGVTSLEKLLGRHTDVAEFAARLTSHFGDVFNREMMAIEQAVTAI